MIVLPTAKRFSATGFFGRRAGTGPRRLSVGARSGQRISVRPTTDRKVAVPAASKARGRPSLMIARTPPRILNFL